MLQIYPAIDLRNGKCVRLKQGDYNQETIFGDNPVEMAIRWEQEGGNVLHVVDLDGAKAGQPVNHHVVAEMRKQLKIPIQLGGGIRTSETIKMLLEEVGLDRVIVGTQALKNPDWFKSEVTKYPHKIVLGIDARNSCVATAGWLDVSQTPALELAEHYRGLPLAGLVYTNIANDGMMQGIDTQTLDDMCQLADMGFPVIASGGVTSLKDIENLKARHTSHPHLTGMIIGRALYEGALSISTVAKSL